ncbi:MAG: hypothetical protein ACP5T2_03775 [Thermoprotei archaeon]
MSFKEKIKSAIDYLYSAENSDNLWTVAQILVILAVAFLIGGGIYVLYYGYPFAIFSSSQIYYVYPGSIQVGAEVIIIGTFLIMTVGGFYLIMRATNNVEDPELYQQLLYIGAALILIGFLGLFAVAAMK